MIDTLDDLENTARLPAYNPDKRRGPKGNHRVPGDCHRQGKSPRTLTAAELKGWGRAPEERKSSGTVEAIRRSIEHRCLTK